MARIFIVQKPTGYGGKEIFDFTPAEKRGELIEILPSHINFVAGVESASKILEDRIRELKPTEDDYLIMTGSPIAIALAAVFWAENCEVFNFLQWSKSINDYKLISLDLGLPN